MINSPFSYNINTVTPSNLEQESISKTNSGIYSEDQNMSNDFQSNSSSSLNTHFITSISFKDIELDNDSPLEEQNNNSLEEDDFLEDFLNEDKGVSLGFLDDQVYASLAENSEDSLEDFLASKEDTPNVPLQITISQSRQDVALPIQASKLIKPLSAEAGSNYLAYLTPSAVKQLEATPPQAILNNLHLKKINLEEEHSQETLEELAWAAQNAAFAHIKQNEQGETEVRLASQYTDLLEKHNIKQIKITNTKGEEVENIDVNNIKITQFTPEEINSICQQVFRYIHEINSKLLEQQKLQKKDEDSRKLNESHFHLSDNLRKNKTDETPKAKAINPLAKKVAINVLKMLNTLIKKQKELEKIKEERAEEKDRQFWENKHLIIQKNIQKFEILRDTIKEQALAHSIALSEQNQAFFKSHVFNIIYISL
ncbi:hypothetical protein [Candidatus Protochlamydia phocaeensis]|uniref:hypothetical protein n=1 Tax=Candidatus Protochlamydia phocaeensis TaxID=1414722 RepID=UPI000838493F|nr:hypothetical protein [Candidatus Protochlamydia phocaeensis]